VTEMSSSLKTFSRVYLALMFLLALTVTAGLYPFGPWGIVLSLFIAGAKASLVAVFFMKLRYDTPSLRLIAWASLLWILLMFGFILGDYLTRSEIGVLGK
jgi:cytochrome c oxidase subunit 4